MPLCHETSSAFPFRCHSASRGLDVARYGFRVVSCGFRVVSCALRVSLHVTRSHSLASGQNHCFHPVVNGTPKCGSASIRVDPRSWGSTVDPQGIHALIHAGSTVGLHFFFSEPRGFHCNPRVNPRFSTEGFAINPHVNPRFSAEQIEDVNPPWITNLG